MEKIGELLSDEESVKQLSELAQMLMNDTKADENSSEDKKEDSSSEETGDGLFGGGFDFSSLLKLQEIMGVISQKDKNSELLLALKPHLSEEKQEKVDKAIKILKILAVWNIVKESGMLKDFL